MTILKVESKIYNWKQSNNKIKGRLTESDNLGFTLELHHPINKSIMIVDDIITMTNKDTDFTLDFNIDTEIQFDIKGLKPTTNELYEAYLKVKDNEDEVIWEKLKEMMILIARPKNRRSFNHLETVFEELIQITYPLN